MKNYSLVVFSLLVCFISACSRADVPELKKAVLQLHFEDNEKIKDLEFSGDGHSFAKGIAGKALNLKPDNGYSSANLGRLTLDGSTDFSIQCWIKTDSDKAMVFLSQKDFPRKGIADQKNAGWVLYSSGGTFAWSIGSGNRRIKYERDNGTKMPVNDGQWHQLTLTFNKESSQFCLYYDGRNTAVYNVGFDFLNNQPLLLGSIKNEFDFENRNLPEIENGAKQLQLLVDEFNRLSIRTLRVTSSSILS